MTSKPDRVLSAEALGEGRALLAGASLQPWYFPDDGGHLIYGNRGLVGIAGVMRGSEADPKPARANAALIVWLVNNAPALLDAAERVRELEAALQEIADLHDPYADWSNQMAEAAHAALRGEKT